MKNRKKPLRSRRIVLRLLARGFRLSVRTIYKDYSAAEIPDRRYCTLYRIDSGHVVKVIRTRWEVVVPLINRGEIECKYIIGRDRYYGLPKRTPRKSTPGDRQDATGGAAVP